MMEACVATREAELAILRLGENADAIAKHEYVETKIGSLDRSCQRLRASIPKQQQTIITMFEKGVVDECKVILGNAQGLHSRVASQIVALQMNGVVLVTDQLHNMINDSKEIADWCSATKEIDRFKDLVPHYEQKLSACDFDSMMVVAAKLWEERLHLTLTSPNRIT